MQFSDTSNKNGMIQEIEFWTGLGDAVVSGNTTLRKQFTSRINRAFERRLPLLVTNRDQLRWDDTNHTDLPIVTGDLASGQGDYQCLVDDNGVAVINITNVMFLDSATSTEYRELTRLTLDDPRALSAMSPNPSEVGVPSHFVEKDNTVFLYPQPNYSKTSGIKLFIERSQSYFVDTDTTKRPGTPIHFDQLYPLDASLDWLLVNKSGETNLIAAVTAQVAKLEKNLKKAINVRGPVRRRLIGAPNRSV
jgi:hypothetical protein